jgi:hypothetical protein
MLTGMSPPPMAWKEYTNTTKQSGESHFPYIHLYRVGLEAFHGRKACSR